MLTKIIATKKQEIQSLHLPNMEHVEHKSLYHAIKNRVNKIGVIAEVKKASPSKGIIKEDFHPIEIAKSYELGGADAISVLTDHTYFKGKREYLTEIKKATSIPIFRKDFILEKIQVDESKRIGADAILLIGEALTPSKLFELYEMAYLLGMECIVEVHSLETLQAILELFTPQIIGINNRNLKTFETNLDQTSKIAKFIPKESILVSESGITSFKDICNVKASGADAVLVGETLMKAVNQEIAIKQLLGV